LSSPCPPSITFRASVSIRRRPLVGHWGG